MMLSSTTRRRSNTREEDDDEFNKEEEDPHQPQRVVYNRAYWFFTRHIPFRIRRPMAIHRKSLFATQSISIILTATFHRRSLIFESHNKPSHARKLTAHAVACEYFFAPHTHPLTSQAWSWIHLLSIYLSPMAREDLQAWNTHSFPSLSRSWI